MGAAVGAAGAQAETIRMSRIIATGLHMFASETLLGLARIYYHTELFVIGTSWLAMIKSVPTWKPRVGNHDEKIQT
jgi:hypothetical protein